MFGYGVDDLGANVHFLDEVGRLKEIEISDAKEYLKEANNLNDKDYREECARAAKAVKKVWNEIETTFLPTRSKYSG